MILPKEYYRNKDVQQRLAEYCGGQAVDPESFSTEYISGVGENFQPDRVSEEYFFTTSRSSFSGLLDQGVDLFRAVWDRSATLGVLDIEYFNHRYPAEAYFNPGRTFALLESVCRRIEKIFNKFGIPYLQIMTGQGYHFTFQVPFMSRSHAQLVALGQLESSLKEKYGSTQGRLTRTVPESVGRAFNGMGKLMEYVVHLLLRDLKNNYKGIPVVCTDLAIASSAREGISLDLSMYGDPLYMRDIRCPFSTYQKHIYLQGKFGARAAREIPVFVTLPRTPGRPVEGYLSMRSDQASSEEHAARVNTKIPDASAGIGKLITSYKASRLYRFHKLFDAVEHDPVSRWQQTYDRVDSASLPACVAHGLSYPNDNLLKPTNLQTLTRVLLRSGWHPKHIAGLVRSKFEKDLGWGSLWNKYDTATRANFYVRLFAGLLAAGIDREDDLQCGAHAEKGYCWNPACGFDLSRYIIPSLLIKRG